MSLLLLINLMHHCRVTRKRYLTVVGVDGDPVLVAQVLTGSVSQMDGDTGVYSGQLCWGSELLGMVMPLKTDRENNHNIGYIGIPNWFLQGCDFSVYGFPYFLP